MKFISKKLAFLMALLAIATGLVSTGCDSGSSSATATPISNPANGGAEQKPPVSVPTSELPPGDQPTAQPGVSTPPTTDATPTAPTSN